MWVKCRTVCVASGSDHGSGQKAPLNLGILLNRRWGQSALENPFSCPTTLPILRRLFLRQLTCCEQD